MGASGDLAKLAARGGKIRRKLPSPRRSVAVPIFAVATVVGAGLACGLLIAARKTTVPPPPKHVPVAVERPVQRAEPVGSRQTMPNSMQEAERKKAERELAQERQLAASRMAHAVALERAGKPVDAERVMIDMLNGHWAEAWPEGWRETLTRIQAKLPHPVTFFGITGRVRERRSP